MGMGTGLFVIWWLLVITIALIALAVLVFPPLRALEVYCRGAAKDIQEVFDRGCKLGDKFKEFKDLHPYGWAYMQSKSFVEGWYLFNKEDILDQTGSEIKIRLWLIPKEQSFSVEFTGAGYWVKRSHVVFADRAIMSIRAQVETSLKEEVKGEPENETK